MFPRSDLVAINDKCDREINVATVLSDYKKKRRQRETKGGEEWKEDSRSHHQLVVITAVCH